MIAVFAVENINVQIQIGVGAKCAKKFLNKLKIKLTYRCYFLRSGIVQKGPSAQVNRHANQGFIHREQRPAVTAYSRLIPQRLSKTFAQDDARILYAMMKVDLQITTYVDLEIEDAVFAEKSEHMVKKGNPGLNGG